MNKLGTTLAAVFAVFLMALVVQILYVIWRRRRFHRAVSVVSGGGDVESSVDSFYTASGATVTLPSKELLYFFCWKSQASTRIEPDSTATATATATAPPLPAAAALDADVLDDEVLKIYGRSRLLFTIKEEEMEEMETEVLPSSDAAPPAATMNELNKDFDDEEMENEVEKNGICLVVEAEELTPFSTPCASPPYYTPSPSPSREEVPLGDYQLGIISLVA